MTKTLTVHWEAYITFYKFIIISHQIMACSFAIMKALIISFAKVCQYCHHYQAFLKEVIRFFITLFLFL